MKKALIVEDFLPIAEIWKFALLKANYNNVEIISNGEKVEDFVHEFLPNLVVMDVSLEGKYDGIYLTQILTEKYQDIKILGASIHSEPQVYNQMMYAGAQGYFVKSSPLSEFQTAVENIEKGEKFICNLMQESLQV